MREAPKRRLHLHAPKWQRFTALRLSSKALGQWAMGLSDRYELEKRAQQTAAM